MVDVALLEQYMAGGLNILITGEAGTGKTTMLEEAAKNLGWKMKYFSSSTLDPFADLIGIPIPNNGRKSVEYYRPRELDEADVVFFDELNRADLMVLNAVFEIIQLRRINGEKLDNLKCCVAAINPVSEGYATRDLDQALKDRFDLYLESNPHPSWKYFEKKFGDPYARVGFELYKEYQNQRKMGAPLPYFSPRRLDKMLEIYKRFRVIDTLRGVVPPNGVIDFQDWSHRLNVGLGFIENEDRKFSLDDKVEDIRYKLVNDYVGNPYLTKEIMEIYQVAKRNQHSGWVLLKRELALSLNQFVKTVKELQEWKPVISDFSLEELKILTTGWDTDRTANARAMVLSH